MNIALSILVVVWVISFPFYTFSIIGTLSLDNILAPMVVLLSGLKLIFGGKLYNKGKYLSVISLTCVFAVYGVGQVLSVQGSPDLVNRLLIGVGKEYLYFIAPIFYLSDFRELRAMTFAMNIVVLLGTVSVLLVSLGLLHLNLERFAQSRIDINIPRSIGLFSNYGDLAIITSYALLANAVAPIFKSGFLNKAMLMLVFILMIVGQIGAQSRNYVLTVLICLLSYPVMRHILKRNTAYAVVSILSVLGSAVIVTSTLVVVEVNLISDLKGWGGSQAVATADARLAQYSFAWGIIKDNKQQPTEINIELPEEHLPR